MPVHPTPLALAIGTAARSASCAQSPDRPWYVYLAQDFTQESNILSSTTGSETSDTISMTTLRGGLNLPFDRQRAHATAALNHQRFSNIDARNNSGFDLGAGLDWSTIEHLSGSLSLNAGRQQADFNVGGIVPVTVSNVEGTQEFNAHVRLGADTQLAFEGGAGQRRVSFTATEFAAREYRQGSGNLDLTYRPSGTLTLGAGINVQRTKFLAPAVGQTAADKNELQGIDGPASWVPTGASTINARITIGKTKFDRATAAKFDGATGSLAWGWQLTALLNLTTTLSRDAGQESGFLRLVEGGTVSATDFSEVTSALAVQAGYEVTGKIALAGGVAYSQRNLVVGFAGIAGNDSTTTVAPGARWAATRTVAFCCNASRESRSAFGVGSTALDNDGFGCFGQITLDWPVWRPQFC